MIENIDGQTMDARVTGILIAHVGAFRSGELKMGSLARYNMANNDFPS